MLIQEKFPRTLILHLLWLEWGVKCPENEKMIKYPFVTKGVRTPETFGGPSFSFPHFCFMCFSVLVLPFLPSYAVYPMIWFFFSLPSLLPSLPPSLFLSFLL